jgi:hypothetical protein
MALLPVLANSRPATNPSADRDTTRCPTEFQIERYKSALAPKGSGPCLPCYARVIKMLDKTERSDRAPNPNEKPESCYCSALDASQMRTYARY